MNIIRNLCVHLHGTGIRGTAASVVDHVRLRRAVRQFDTGPGAAPFRGSSPSNTFDRPDGTSRIAIQAHIFYPLMCDELIAQLDLIPYRFDCWVTTDTPEKADAIRQTFGQHCKAQYCHIDVVENRGRDVAPFLRQMQGKLDGYDYLCHVHTKSSGTVEWGDGWRTYLHRNLFGSTRNISQIFATFEENPQVGLIFPERYPLIMGYFLGGWTSYSIAIKKLLTHLGFPDANMKGPIVYPAGTMFWARTVAVRQLFEEETIDFDAFAPEADQVESTFAHVIERSWVYLARANGFSSVKSINLSSRRVMHAKRDETITRLAFFVIVSTDGSISDEDRLTLAALHSEVTHLVLISNGMLAPATREALTTMVDEIVERNNTGYDFGAWKEALLSHRAIIESGSYAQVVIANNSATAPLEPLSNIFDDMSGTADFWGITAFPNHKDVPRHLQSYFLVFERPTWSSPAFWTYWEQLPIPKDRAEAIKVGECALTPTLEQAGLSWRAYCPAAEWFEKEVNVDLVYSFPYEAAILGVPLLKKKALVNRNDTQVKKALALITR
jgi:lipopolysaccharide biosynthesis protein